MDGDYDDLPRQLRAACECGDLEAVQQLLDDEDSTISVDCDLGEGVTPLQVAAAHGHEGLARLLLMRGARLDAQNGYGWTALMQASFHGNTAIAVLLLQNKADPMLRNKMGATALTLAAYDGHTELLNVFLDISGLDENDRMSDGVSAQQTITPMVAALVNGHTNILRQLLERGSDESFTDSGTGWTLLMMAALGGHNEAAQCLIDSGCDPNAININNSTAFDIAAVSKKRKVKELLEKKTSNRPTTSDKNSESKVIEATEQGDIRQVQRILDQDPAQSNRLSADGATPLMVAAMLGHRDIAELLVQRGAEVNRRDGKSGWTALMQATFHRRKEVVKYLIQAGADLNIQARDGCKALDLALVIVSEETDKGGSELIRLLAPVTMPTSVGGPPRSQVKGQGNSQMWSTRTSSLDQMADEEAAKRSGLKAWWSRMSNRFRNLKLTRTLRGSLGVTKLTPFEDDSARPDETLRSVGKSGSSTYINGGQQTTLGNDGTAGGKNHQRKKSKEGSRVSFTKSSIKAPVDVVQTLDVQSPQSKFHDKLLPVIPPFLPPPSFQLHNADKSRRSHSKAQGMGPGRPSTQNTITLTTTNTTATSTGSTTPINNNTTTTTASSHRSQHPHHHHRPMFTARRGTTGSMSSGISPSNSAHFSSIHTISPSSSGEASALSRGLLSSAAAASSRHSASGRLINSNGQMRDGLVSGSAGGDLRTHRKRYPSASSVPSLAQIPSSPVSRPRGASFSDKSTTPTEREEPQSVMLRAATLSSGSSSSLTRPRGGPRSHSGSASTKGSTSSTLTPSPSPTPLGGRGRGGSSGRGSIHSEGDGIGLGGRAGGGREGLTRKTSAGSSSISEEDELSHLLRKLSLEKYAPIFEEQEVDMEAFLALNDSDLKEMGIQHKEPRSQILTAITQINTGKGAGPDGGGADHRDYSPSMARLAFQR